MLKLQHILTYRLRFLIEIGVCVNVATLQKDSARKRTTKKSILTLL